MVNILPLHLKILNDVAQYALLDAIVVFIPSSFLIFFLFPVGEIIIP
jgi:hypothetical protein